MENPNVPQRTPPIVRAEIRIVMEGSNVMVQAPMENRVLCYGLLEIAREIIATNAPQPTNEVGPVAPPLTLPKNGILKVS